MEIEDFTLPKLEYFYNIGYIDTLKNAYLKLKDIYINSYPFLEKYDDETIAVYIAYFTQTVGKNKLDFDTMIKYLEGDATLEDKREYIGNFFTIIVDDLFKHLKARESNQEENGFKKTYNSYVLANNIEYDIYDDVLKFMKKNYNINIENAVRSYFLTGGKLDFDKIGIVKEDEEYIFFATYCVYLTIYKNFIKVKTVQEKRKYQKSLKKLDVEKSKKIVNSTLENINNSLFCEKEYKEIYDTRIYNINEIISISESEMKRLKESGFKRVRK